MRYTLHISTALEKQIARNCDILHVARKNLLLIAFVKGYSKIPNKKDPASYIKKLINKYHRSNKNKPLSVTISFKVSDYIDQQVKDLKTQVDAYQQDIFLAIATNEFPSIEDALKQKSISYEVFGYQSECRALLKCLGSERKDFQRIAEAFFLHELLSEIYSDITRNPECFALINENL